MRKEVLWAAAIGITFGLVIAFGAWRINSSLKPRIMEKIKETPRPEPTNEFKITLDKPQNEDVLVDSAVEASGITKPQSWIVVSGEADDYIIHAGDDGSFKENVALIPGINQIKVTAFGADGTQSFEKVLVVYSSAFLMRGAATEAINNESTGEASIRQKVQEKVEAALNKPKAYIGTVTDIAESTIQIKTQKGEIRQIATSDGDTATVKSSGTTTKTIKLSDVAIGDFIVAMGYINSNAVISAQRILVTDPITEPKVSVNFAMVTNNQKDITVSNKVDGKEGKITLGKKVLIYDFSTDKPSKIKQTDILKNSLVVYVATGEEGSQTVRSVFLIQKPQS